jgi:hypothetical protein
MQKVNGSKLGVTTALASLAMVGGSAMAAGGTDFSGILDGVDGTTAVAAIVAAAAIIALVGFAKWGAKKVATFFS